MGKLALDGVGLLAGSSPMLDGIAFEAEPGRILAVTGASGAGKTSLLSVAGGLLAPTTGSVTFDGGPVGTRSGEPRTGTALVLQTYGLLPTLTAEETVAIALRALGVEGGEATRRAVEVLASAVAQSRWRAYEVASLRVVGLKQRDLVRASVLEYVAMLGFAVVLGVVSAYLSLTLVLPSIDLGGAEPNAPAAQYDVHWLVLGGVGLTLFVLATGIAYLISRRVTRLGRPSTLRWAERV